MNIASSNHHQTHSQYAVSAAFLNCIIAQESSLLFTKVFICIRLISAPNPSLSNGAVSPHNEFPCRAHALTKFIPQHTLSLYSTRNCPPLPTSHPPSFKSFTSTKPEAWQLRWRLQQMASTAITMGSQPSSQLQRRLDQLTPPQSLSLPLLLPPLPLRKPIHKRLVGTSSSNTTPTSPRAPSEYTCSTARDPNSSPVLKPRKLSRLLVSR
jgi:hypothetical protein